MRSVQSGSVFVVSAAISTDILHFLARVLVIHAARDCERRKVPSLDRRTAAQNDEHVLQTPTVIEASALRAVLAVLTGWLDRREREVLRYLVEENRVYSGHMGNSSFWRWPVWTIQGANRISHDLARLSMGWG